MEPIKRNVSISDQDALQGNGAARADVARGRRHLIARGRSGLAVRAALASLVSLALASPQLAAAGVDEIRELPDGAMLDQSNWQIAEGLLPPEVLGLYKKGDYKNPVRKIEHMKGTPYDPRLRELSKKNEGRYKINENGTVVDVKTGKRPEVITGWPFPTIDPKDPQAGVKAMWNSMYTLYWAGSFHTNTPINWVDRDQGLLRRIVTEVNFKYYDGQPPEFQKEIDNPDNILSRTLALVREPSDLNGVISLNWRYREGDKTDQSWAYVPALRRVRPINPANRADGFMGSDISQDDGPYFDGKPEDFEFKLIGEGFILGSYDGPGLDKPKFPEQIKPGQEISDLIPDSEHGWHFTYPEMPLIASQEGGWKSGEGMVAWAPIQMALVLRPVWIVEAKPKNPYYIFGKQVMYLDKESFRGFWKQKFDWKGEALANWQLPESLIYPVDGEPGHVRIGGGGSVAVMNNFKQDRATVTGMPVSPTDWWVDRPDEIFQTARILRSGK